MRLGQVTEQPANGKIAREGTYTTTPRFSPTTLLAASTRPPAPLSGPFGLVFLVWGAYA